jgi:hypothetical protein
MLDREAAPKLTQIRPDAGMRIEPPPSPPLAAGTKRAATAAAEPPLEPPGECASDQGLRVGPCSAGSV